MGEPQGAEDREEDEVEDNVFNLDEVEFEPTGDDVLDRGRKMSIKELREATADPEHPDHEAAKAANAHFAQQLKSIQQSVYGDTFRRISENLNAAVRPDLSKAFQIPKLDVPRIAVPRVDIAPRAEGSLPPAVRRVEMNHGDLATDDTPERTLGALVDVSERMSEMVRVSAELRDTGLGQMEHMSEMVRVSAEQREVAVRQMEHFQAEAQASRRAEKKMFVLSLVATVGSWVAVLVTIVTLVLTR